MDYQRILDEIRDEVRPLIGSGRVTPAIPPLASISADRFGMALRTIDGELAATGDSRLAFSVQSIAKVFILTLAVGLEGDAVWRRVHREPSGNPFNSLVQLEAENGIPRNPFINAGAIVMTDLVTSHTGDAARAVLDLVRRASQNQEIEIDAGVARAEREVAHRNRALAHFLKSFGNLHNDVDEVLDAYFRICALSMSCVDLAAAFGYLAAEGRSPDTGEAIAAARSVKRINAIMMTCGVYDAAGDFAYRVGLPGKSGIGGGVVTVMPGRFVAAAYSPGLDEAGNSVAATMALELLTTKTGVSIF
jgi:glutaminase